MLLVEVILLHILTELSLIFALCLAGEGIAALLPVAFPASVISMVLLFLLLAAKLLRPHHIKEKSNFLITNMACFFVPAGVGILRYADVLWANLLPLLAICFITTPLVYGVTAWAVQLTMRAIEAVTTSPLFGIVLCIGTFQIGRWVQKKTGLTLANPLVIAILLCIGVLLIFDIPYEDFAIGGDIVNMMLGPATAVLALNIYNQYAVLKRHFVPVLVGCTAGSLFSLASVLLLCRLFRLDEAVTAALLPKSCTTPIAVGIAESHGGIAAITMVAVLVTGFIGAVCAPLFAKLMHVTEPVAEGLAIGACSHALGTTKAAELGEVQGAMSGIAIGVCGLITVVAALFL